MDTISILYTKCQFCSAKINCERCSRELEAALEVKPGIRSVQVNVPDKKVWLEYDLDPDDLEDMLDELGLLMA